MAGTMAEKWRKNGKVGAADRRSTNDKGSADVLS